MNDEDVGRSCSSARNVDEVDVVLRESRNRLVVSTEGGLLDVGPIKGGGLRGLQFAHVQEVQFVVRDRVKDVRVVIEDSDEVREVKLASVRLLG